ncbi:MAG: VWA domain-containing protein [Actinobacteria bacterium 13_2_20CM_2_71_6]|nr:MAG: VWA domain-containing protein [Actinobacteria bacterium 13_2_20CM_2_71_6]
MVSVLVLAVLAGWGGYRLLNSPTCASRVTIDVAAAPEIASVIRATAGEWSSGSGAGACASIVVTAAEPADVAAAIAGQRGATLTGLGQANGKARVPEVWIPDASTWLQRVRAVGADLVPADATSVAQSPVVLAMPQPVAAALGWPKTRLTWAALLQKMTTGGGLKTGIVEPGRDASGLSGLLALRTAAASAGGAGAQEATVAALRALAIGRSTLREDLLGRFPRATDAAALASGLSAAPLPEAAVMTYNATQPPVPLSGVFLDPAPPALDYPFAVLPGSRPEVSTAARQLLGALSGNGYRDLLAQHGLRNPDGTTGTGFTAGQGAPTGPIPAVPATDPGLIQQTLSTWTAVTQPGRILAVIDVSGSMLTPVPTAGGANREQVLVKAATGGLSLFDDTWAVGLWIFSTKLDGNVPWKELVPIGPLVGQRSQVLGALSTIQPTHGDTGLYDTVLAGYKRVQENWDPGKVNSVIVMTDGQNDNPGGLTLDQLVSELQKVVDPKRPVEVIALGIGTEVSKPELTRITQTTGGGVFIATDPAKIGEIFLQAIALRPGSGG